LLKMAHVLTVNGRITISKKAKESKHMKTVTITKVNTKMARGTAKVACTKRVITEVTQETGLKAYKKETAPA